VKLRRKDTECRPDIAFVRPLRSNLTERSSTLSYVTWKRKSGVALPGLHSPMFARLYAPATMTVMPTYRRARSRDGVTAMTAIALGLLK
jgi:hypothetical protein